jgi:hypothetical protein
MLTDNPYARPECRPKFGLEPCEFRVRRARPQVGSLADARAALAAGVDAVIAQGSEAGGRG